MQRKVQNTYKNRFNQNSTVTINDEQIHEIGEGEETRISISEVEKIYETSQYFFIRIKSGTTLIMPKEKIHDLYMITNELKTISDKKYIPYIEMRNWRWK